MAAQCPFCSPVSAEIVLRNLLCYARYDRYPVGKGHLLIVPFRHVANFFELTEDERKAAFELVWQAKAKLDADFRPDGYNMGVNVGQAAGQTIMHPYLSDPPLSRGHGAAERRRKRSDSRKADLSGKLSWQYVRPSSGRALAGNLTAEHSGL